MIDMLVRLYDLDTFCDIPTLYKKVEDQGIILRRPGAYERHLVADFVGQHFSPKWVSETKIAFSRQPLSIYIATRDKEILGFACYETSHRGYFGPTGVAEAARGTGIGKALLFKALESLKDMGYAYAIIGGVGPKEFYAKTCQAIEIPNSDPSIYRDILPEPEA